MLDSVASIWLLASFMLASRADDLGMKDTARHYFFKLVTERVEITLIRNDVSMPELPFAAIVTKSARSKRGI